MAHIGYVGLGTMGGRMVERLLAKGHTVTGYNRTRAKAEWLVAKGMRWADSTGAVCAGADVVISMVTNSAALEDIATGIIPALKAGQVWVDMSTVAPAVARALAAQVRAKGADMMDAPVS